MANRRLVGGRTTEERIAETFAAIQASGERLALTEFARRAQVGYSTLCHEYKEWAERIRKHRDGRTRRAGRDTSPPEGDETQELITQLRRQMAVLRKEQEELGQRIPALVAEVTALRQTNARLRGVQIRIHEALVAALGEQQADQILSRATAASAQPTDTEGEPF